jgi:outer membrane assembly lipoprotein YfiO
MRFCTWRRLLLLALPLLLVTACSNTESRVGMPGAEGDFEAGQRAYENGHHLRAIELLEMFETRHPGSRFVDDALYFLGLAHQTNNEQILARQAFNRLIDAYPRSEFAEEAYFEIAHCWYRSKRRPELDPEPAEEAVRSFNIYLRRYPGGQRVTEAESSIDELLNMLAKKDYLNGETYRKLGRYQAARRYYQKALDRLDNANCAALVWKGIATTYGKEKEFAKELEAYQSLQQLLLINPENYESGDEMARFAQQKLAAYQ